MKNLHTSDAQRFAGQPASVFNFFYLHNGVLLLMEFCSLQVGTNISSFYVLTMIFHCVSLNIIGVSPSFCATRDKNIALPSVVQGVTVTAYGANT